MYVLPNVLYICVCHCVCVPVHMCVCVRFRYRHIVASSKEFGNVPSVSVSFFLSVYCLFVFVLFCLFFCFVFLVFRDRVSLYSPGCPGPHFVDQAGLELRNPPACACQLIGLKA